MTILCALMGGFRWAFVGVLRSGPSALALAGESRRGRAGERLAERIDAFNTMQRGQGRTGLVAWNMSLYNEKSVDTV